MQKFEAGGNHTIFMIDEFMPFKTKFEVPALLGVQPKTAAGKNSAPAKKQEPDNYKYADVNLAPNERESVNKVLTNTEIIEKILELQKQALDNARYYLQLTYCDTTFMHRFVHFEVDPDFIEQFEPLLNEYIDNLKTLENEGILHYHL